MGKTVASTSRGLFHFPLTSKNVYVLHIHMAATRELGEERAERCLMMLSMSLQVHICGGQLNRNDIRIVVQKPFDIIADP